MRDLKEINRIRIAYALPDMEKIPVRKGIVYKTVEAEELKMDVYYPFDMRPDTLHPAVIFVHGGSRPEHVEQVNESQPYISWSQLIAASGFIAVMFKHRTDEGYTRLPEAASDIDDLIAYVRDNSTTLQIDQDSLAIWTASSGPPTGLRTALRDRPAYIRCIVAYYGIMSLMNRAYFSYSEAEVPLVQEFSPTYHLSQQDPTKVAPIFVAKAALDRPFLNESIDEFVRVASEHNIPITFMNHPTGMHGFDIINDDARTREIIKATLVFIQEHLKR